MADTTHNGRAYDYLVWPERRILIRVSIEAVEQFCPTAEEKWRESPRLEGVRSGSGDFDHFVRISADEADRYAAQFQAATGPVGNRP